ncbi:TonB-dependent receptor [Piscinibacter sp.]|uniref:TonB-dependent receptor n=1 Tax=Piscinibacter sp. TaxID=1903157 RepID=UPI0039E53012
MTRLRPIVAALWACGLLAGVHPLHAAAAAEEAELPAVTVTAKGYAADNAETPASVLSQERRDWQARGAANVGDALRGEPGLAVAGDSAQGANPVIRGLKRESVVLLVDGMRLNSAQPAGAIASFMSLGLAERLEVVKGPSSVLYGTGALGGAINVLLPQARFVDGLKAELSLGADSVRHGASGAGVLNLAQGDHALMLGASALRAKDYRAPGGSVARTGYDSEALIGQYRFRIDARQQLRLSAQRHLDEDVWYPGSTRPLPNPALGSTTVHSPTQQRRLYEAGYNFSEAGVEVDLRAYRQEMRREIWSWANQLRRDTARTSVAFETDGLDARARWAWGEAQVLSAGVNAWRMGASPARYLANPTPMSPLVRNDPFADARIRSLGAYVQDDVRLGAWGLVAGLRHDRVKGDAASMSNGAVRSGLARSDGSTSGSLGVMYEADALLRPYAQIARAFRAGEMRERYEASPRGDGYFYLGNPQIAPEQSTQIEIGAKGESPRLVWSAALYRNRITDFITGRPTGAVQNGLPVKATVNLGRVVIEGLEAQVRGKVLAEHWLSASLSLLRGTNKDLDEPLFQMPADELSLGWDARWSAEWASDARLRLVRRQTRVATAFSLGGENATPGFATLDLGATWSFAKGQRLRMALRNLADKGYHEHLTEGLSGQEIQAPGRSLLLSWQGSF